jgi:hypothetical protein
LPAETSVPVGEAVAVASHIFLPPLAFAR